MLRTPAAAICFGISATGGFAQGACPSEEILASLDPCVMGNWIGTTTALNAFERAMESMEGVSVTPGAPPALGMIVDPDGYFITFSFNVDALAVISKPESTSILRLDLAVPSASGRIWTEDGTLSMCEGDDLPPWLELFVSNSAGAHDGGGLPPGPGGDFIPLMHYTCEGNEMSFTVELPDPIGPVHYDLVHVPSSRFDEEFRRSLEERFGPE